MVEIRTDHVAGKHMRNQQHVDKLDPFLRRSLLKILSLLRHFAGLTLDSSTDDSVLGTVIRQRSWDWAKNFGARRQQCV